MNTDMNNMQKKEEPQTFNLSNQGGNPNDFDRVKKIIKNKNIIILEDNCESLGAKYNNQF